MTDVFRAFETPDKVRRDFDAMLKRVETGMQGAYYDMVDHAADVALAIKFVELCWDDLEHREQMKYWSAVKWLQSRKRPAT